MQLIGCIRKKTLSFCMNSPWTTMNDGLEQKIGNHGFFWDFVGFLLIFVSEIKEG
jgi:hypothetical protein